MAAPAVPTLVSITTEGLIKSGITTPSAAQLTRAQDEWMNEIKNDIAVLFGGKKLEFLQAERVLALTDGLQKYSQPTDFHSHLSMQILDGSVQGTAQAGAATTITLAAAETISSTEMIGSEIVITGGTGPNQIRQCTGYDTSTKIATISPAWTVNPAIGSTYMVVSAYNHLSPAPIWEMAKSVVVAEKGQPTSYLPTGDSDDGELILYPTPYRNETGKVYVLRQRYYVDLMEVDLAGTLAGTLYKRWRNIWIQGVLAKSLQDNDDTRAVAEGSKYNAMVKMMVAQETYGVDLSNLQMQVAE